MIHPNPTSLQVLPLHLTFLDLQHFHCLQNTRFGTGQIPNEVIELNSNNFLETISAENTLVFFYAPWCGHCKKTKPVYEQAASKASEGIAQFARIDCNDDSNRPICSSFDITGYPTVVYIDATTKTFIEYNGERTAPEFFKFTLTAKATKKIPALPEPQPLPGPISRLIDSINEDLNTAFNIRKNVFLILVGFGFVIGYITKTYIGTLVPNKKKSKRV